MNLQHTAEIPRQDATADHPSPYAGRHRAEPGRPRLVRVGDYAPRHAKREWCCPRCLYTTDDTAEGMAHIRGHRSGAIPPMAEAEITAAVEAAYGTPPAPLPLPQPRPVPAPIPTPGGPQPDANGGGR